MSERERFAVIMTDILTMLFIWWQTGELDIAVIGLIVQGVGFVAYKLFPEKDVVNDCCGGPAVP